MTAYSLLTFAIPDYDKNDPWIEVMQSIPDTFFFINYILLVYQTMNIFYHSHMENSIHVSLLMHFSRPKFRKARQIIKIILFSWLGFMGLIYVLFLNDIIELIFIETEFTIVNLLSGTLVLVFLIYLYSKFLETPFKSVQDRVNLKVCSKVLFIWTLGRYYKGFLGLLEYRSSSVLSYLADPNDSTLGGDAMIMSQTLISEIICFIIVLDYRFINIFISQDEANTKKEGIKENLNRPSSEITSSPEFVLDESDIQVKELYKHRDKGMGQLFIATYKTEPVLYRKLQFSRVSGYVIEDIKSEIEDLKSNNCSILVPFYGAIMNLPCIGLVVSKVSRSLFQLIHEDKVILSLKQKLKLIKQIVSAIKVLHEKELYHGHLSSHNILLESSGSEYNPLISDLGLEKLKKFAGIALDYTNKSVWTSPELLADRCRTVVKASPADDIYSIGIIIWEVMTGELPLEDLGDNFYEEILVKNSKPTLHSYFPQDLVKVLNLCWAPTASRPNISTLNAKVYKLKLGN